MIGRLLGRAREWVQEMEERAADASWTRWMNLGGNLDLGPLSLGLGASTETLWPEYDVGSADGVWHAHFSGLGVYASITWIKAED